MEEFDYIIIGAGSAGCVLANRLTDDGANSVCILEAGPPDWNPFIHIPAGFMRTLVNPKVNWLYEASPSPWAMQAESPLARHEVRPPVKHAYGVPLEERKEIEAQLHRMMEEKIEDPYQPFVANEGKPQMFQHEHLTHASFNIFSKLPIIPMEKLGDLHRTVLQRIALLVLQSRIQSRYSETNADYKRVELDHSDSAREGCTVTTVTVTCEPREWEFALQVAVEEARRLQKCGLTRGELARFTAAMMEIQCSSHNKPDALHLWKISTLSWNTTLSGTSSWTKSKDTRVCFC